MGSDKLTKERRSENMRRIRSKNTRPELFVRSLVFGLGYRYRLHRATLPGKPDLVFTNRRKVIFVHGCFWHGHSNCAEGRIPNSNRGYWSPKLAANKLRDIRNKRALTKRGWKYLVIWECGMKKPSHIKNRVKTFLESE